MTDRIRKAVDSGTFCGVVLLDLQKAFNAVNHYILLYKLKAMGKLLIRWVYSPILKMEVLELILRV